MKAGFTRGAASACCFYHKQRDLRCIFHGDDFVFVGNDADLLWMEEQMRQRFLVKVVGKLGETRPTLRNSASSIGYCGGPNTGYYTKQIPGTQSSS